MSPRGRLTANHWGTGVVTVRDGRIVEVAAHPADPDPSPINGNLAGSLNGRARILRPAVRLDWLEDGPAPARGRRGPDPFVEVTWDTALDLLAAEIARLRQSHGNDGIYAGSYGWASAGRFHHAQGQLRRFLNGQGGFVASEGNYSYNAALGILPHVVGPYMRQVVDATRWSVIAAESDLVVMFGGLPDRNAQVSDGGLGLHRMAGNLAACRAAGVRFVNLSPLRSDAAEGIGAEWLAPRPGTDVAVMLGLAHTLLAEGLADRGFLDRYTTGFDRFARYVTGEADDVPKDAGWAAAVSGLPAGRIARLAREMAAGRTMITCAAGLQRADHGEQPLWMTVTLAAMLGQIGLPGGGYGIGYGVNATIGNTQRPFRAGALPQGRNPVRRAIPVAMVADMLLDPGGSYAHQGATHLFPDIRMVWWAGGNPFHHHQDLNRLRRASQVPETVVVNEINWTATARHADIVLPVAAAQERDDFAAGNSDNALIPMPACAPPPGAARTEFSIYAALAARLGGAEAFTEGLDEDGWLRRLWDETRAAAGRTGVDLPDWDDFLAGDVIALPDPAPDRVFLSGFRDNPDARPLPTPSGRIEIFSERVAAMDLPDCPGHATFLPVRDAVAPDAAAHPFHLLSGQPATRLHSQLDNGALSRAHKVGGREPVLIHPDDAAALGIRDGDVVELSNARGRCLAGARITDEVRQGCLFLWTGAWYDPDFDDPHHRCRHGNPNVLTHDLRTSALTQSPAAHSARVALRRVDGAVPPVRAHEPPVFVPWPRARGSVTSGAAPSRPGRPAPPSR
ncbi:molybdopterin-dependent oxidoreductase [Roseivivax isoporae]|uniref:molybdopterin-dependent oxidoreductase n=1 Tax=Roseivivax isoporae TaxID=591206 RepID=UPI0004B66650|nr:molybdopterin-dependent oxidoreductase [Roseivivax isoporae]